MDYIEQAFMADNSNAIISIRKNINKKIYIKHNIIPKKTFRYINNARHEQAKSRLTEKRQHLKVILTSLSQGGKKKKGGRWWYALKLFAQTFVVIINIDENVASKMYKKKSIR